MSATLRRLKWDDVAITIWLMPSCIRPHYRVTSHPVILAPRRNLPQVANHRRHSVQPPQNHRTAQAEPSASLPGTGTPPPYAGAGAPSPMAATDRGDQAQPATQAGARGPDRYAPTGPGPEFGPGPDPTSNVGLIRIRILLSTIALLGGSALLLSQQDGKRAPRGWADTPVTIVTSATGEGATPPDPGPALSARPASGTGGTRSGPAAPLVAQRAPAGKAAPPAATAPVAPGTLAVKVAEAAAAAAAASLTHRPAAEKLPVPTAATAIAPAVSAAAATRAPRAAEKPAPQVPVTSAAPAARVAAATAASRAKGRTASETSLNAATRGASKLAKRTAAAALSSAASGTSRVAREPAHRRAVGAANRLARRSAGTHRGVADLSAATPPTAARSSTAERDVTLLSVLLAHYRNRPLPHPGLTKKEAGASPGGASKLEPHRTAARSAHCSGQGTRQASGCGARQCRNARNDGACKQQSAK